MIQRGDGAHFPVEPLTEALRGHFDGDVTAQPCIERLVDLTHAPRPQEAVNLVRSDRDPAARRGTPGSSGRLAVCCASSESTSRLSAGSPAQAASKYDARSSAARVRTA